MGWLYSTEWDSAAKMRDSLRDDLTRAGHEIVKEATVAFGRRYYAACKKNGVTSLFVALIEGSPKNGFGYKDMDEGCGPNDTDCPLSVLAVLSPVEDIYGPVKDDGAAKWATEFRAKCRAHAATRAASASAAKALKPGDKVWLRNTKSNPFTISVVGKNAKGTFRVLGYDEKGLGPYRLPMARLDRVEVANA